MKQSVAALDKKKSPLERTWRGNKAGTVKYEGYPDFKGDKFAEREYVKVSVGLLYLSSEFSG